MTTQEAARRLKANRKIEGKACGWCHQTLMLGDDAAVCTADETTHHGKCWDDRGGCSFQGCVHAPLKRLDQPPPNPPPSHHQMPFGYGAPPPNPAANFGAGVIGPGPGPTYGNPGFSPPPVSAWDAAHSRPPQRAALRPGFKFCTGCGNQVLQDTQICDFCNAILTPDGVYHGPTVNAPGAVASLVYGIISIFFCGVIFGTLAIVKSREARASIAFNPRYGGAGMATAGLITGIVGLVLWGIWVLLWIGGKS